MLRLPTVFRIAMTQVLKLVARSSSHPGAIRALRWYPHRTFVSALGILLLLTAAHPFVAAAREVIAMSPANAQASPASKAVLHFLSELPKLDGKRVLSGQNVGSANMTAVTGFDKYFVVMGKQTGHRPAILGVDYGSEEFSPFKISEINKIIIAHWRAGGLVTISIHPRNPWTGGGLKERDQGGSEYLDVVKAGTDANRRWMADLKVIADGLTELRDAGVIVLWRPLHEMNGDFYWWSSGKDSGWASTQEFTQLWRYTFEHLSNARHLNNLLWVYSTNTQQNDKVRPTDYYYPGDDVVDIVGIDSYANSLDPIAGMSGYDRLIALGKPFAITEVGPAFWIKEHPRGGWDTRVVIDAIRKQYPATTYFVFWHGWKSFFFEAKMGIIDNLHGDELLTDPWVVSLEDLAAGAPGH